MSGSELSCVAIDTDGGRVLCWPKVRCGVTAGETRILGACSEKTKEDDSSVAGVIGRVLSREDGPLRGDLKGERNGFESVFAAASILRRLAAGVDILVISVLSDVRYRSIAVNVRRLTLIRRQTRVASLSTSAM